MYALPFCRVLTCRRLRRLLLALGWSAISFPVSLSAERLELRLIDQQSGTEVVNALVELTRSGRRVTGDGATGWIRFEGIEPGAVHLLIRAPGFEPHTLRVDIADGSLPTREEIYLEPVALELASLTVQAAFSDEDQDALARRASAAPMDQLTGEALRDEADATVGDVLEKIAGVTVTSDGGGVNIRGAGARQTRITVDGQSLPGGGGRGATRGAQAMSQIPREFLDRVQVMKATTPDMDADDIGGSVDLQTSRIAKTRKPRTTVSLRSVRQPAFDTWAHSANVTHALPIALPGPDRRLGLLLTLNVEDRASINERYQVLNQWPSYESRWPSFTSPETAPGERYLARFRSERNASERQRYGLVFNTDLKLGEHHHFFFKTLYAQNQTESTRENLSYEFATARNLIALTPKSGEFDNFRLLKELSRRAPEATTSSLVFGGDHRFEDWKLDHSIGYSSAEDEDYGAPSGRFRTGRAFDGGYTLLPDPAHPQIHLSPSAPLSADIFDFNRFDQADRTSRDAELAVRVNLQRAIEDGGAEWILKTGLKTRLRSGETNRDQAQYSLAGDPFTLELFQQPTLGPIYDDRYDLGPSGDIRALEAFFEREPERFELNALSSAGSSATSDFAVDESIYATYGMVQRTGPRWTLIGGLRVEHTETQTSGFESVTQRINGVNTIEITPVFTEGSYTILFPGFHFLYRAAPGWVARGSLTRTLQRPDFRDLSPSTRVNTDNKTIRSGNPELQPFDAQAIDLGLDFNLSQWGSFSLGAFYKRIEDFIVDIEESTDYLGESGFTRSFPVNGSPSDLYGLEGAWTVDLNFLPGAFEQTAFSLNYTLTDSTAAYPGQPGAETMLPEQVEQTLNARLNWKYKGFSLNLRTRYRGLQLRDLIEPGQDQFSRGYWSHAVSASYQFKPASTLSLGLSNLNEPELYTYQGNAQRPVNNRKSRLNVSLSLNMRFGG